MEITTLIPAYKTEHMLPLLVGLISQTRLSARVIVSDDSPGGVFSEMLRSEGMTTAREGLNLEIHNGPRKGAYENFKHLLRLWDGRTALFHILLDDDVIFPHFYARHASVHADDEFSCSISARWSASVFGQPAGILHVPQEITMSNDRVVALQANALFASTVPHCWNWLGEFSNCVFSHECADILLKPEFADVSYAGSWDLGGFLAASLHAPVAYIQDHLGYFRVGTGHSSEPKGKYLKAAFVAFAALGRGAEKLGRIDHEQALKCYGTLATILHEHYSAERDMEPFCKLLPRMAEDEPSAAAEFEREWARFLTDCGF